MSPHSFGFLVFFSVQKKMKRSLQIKVKQVMKTISLTSKRKNSFFNSCTFHLNFLGIPVTGSEGIQILGPDDAQTAEFG